MIHRTVSILGFSFLLGLSVACQPSHEQSSSPKVYADIAGMVNGHIEDLVASGATLEKVAELDGETEELSVVYDKEAWEKELALFKEVDINTPRLLDAYDIKTEGQSVLYVPKPSSDGLEVQRILLQYEGDKIVAFQAVTEDKNALFTTQRTLTMGFEVVGDSTRLLQYEARGSQKLVFRSPLKFKIAGTINY